MQIPPEEFDGGLEKQVALASEGIEELRKGFEQNKEKITDKEKYLYKHRTISCLKVKLQDLASRNEQPNIVLSHWAALKNGAHLPTEDAGEAANLRHELVLCQN